VRPDPRNYLGSIAWIRTLAPALSAVHAESLGREVMAAGQVAIKWDLRRH
jgi:hypothetical protein